MRGDYEVVVLVLKQEQSYVSSMVNAIHLISIKLMEIQFPLNSVGQSVDKRVSLN